MIKKIIACLTICFIITGTLSPVFSRAEPIPIYTPNWDNPGIAEIINISDLTGWMANGGVYDITNFQNLDEFLTWYFKIRVPVKDEDGNITFAPTYGYETYLDSYHSSPRFIEQSNIRGMISRSYQNKTGYGRRIQEQVDKALLEDGNLNNVNIPLLDKAEAAFFVGYNTNAINSYRGQFNSDQPEIETFAPDWAIPYLNKINGNSSDGFFWSNYPNPIPQFNNSNRIFTLNNGDWSDFTWITNANNIMETSTHTAYVNGVDLLTLNITSNNGVYFVSFSGASTSYITIPNNTSNWALKFNNDSSTVYDFSSISNLNLSSSGTIENVLSYLSNKVRNANIIVDNQIWSISGSNTSTPIIPEFPDVVGGDELPTTTWTLTYPKAPSYINLPGLRQAFQRAKNTDNQFDIMDLTDSLVDPEGDPISDPEMETAPIPLPNPDPINPEVVPELPDLPLIPPADNPGFSGVSVLAEIINFTNQSLPSELITVFWGIVFGAVILGIIKILHK